MRPITPTIELVSPAKRVRAELAVGPVWAGATVYPACPVWRVWYDGQVVIDTSPLGAWAGGGMPAYGLRMTGFTRHRPKTALGAGREFRASFAASDSRGFAACVRITDMSAFCAFGPCEKQDEMRAEPGAPSLPEGSVRLTGEAAGGSRTQVFFTPHGKTVACWRRGSGQHVVFFDRPGDLAEKRFGALDQLERLDVADGSKGVDLLFLSIPFTKAAVTEPLFGEGLTPAYRAAFDLLARRGAAMDEFWVMRGEPGQFMVAAGRQGEDWTIGGITGEPRTLTVRFEDLWLRMPAELRSLAYNVEITRDPVAGEAGTVVRESFEGQAPDVRVALDLARDGGFMVEFRGESGAV